MNEWDAYVCWLFVVAFAENAVFAMKSSVGAVLSSYLDPNIRGMHSTYRGGVSSWTYLESIRNSMQNL